jgi:hypothetical protein
MKNQSLTLILFVFFILYSFSQVQRELVYEINSPGIIYGKGNAVVCDQNNNIYVVGTVRKSSTTWPIFIKMDADGNPLYIDILSLGNGGSSITSYLMITMRLFMLQANYRIQYPTMFIAAYDLFNR